MSPDSLDKKKTDKLNKLWSPVERLSILTHASDLSNTAKDYHLTITWVGLLFKEFFRQGDRELEKKLEISPMCDRQKTHISTLEMGFINYLMKPFYGKMAWLYPEEFAVPLEHLDANFHRYKNKKKLFIMINIEHHLI
eukprot:UN33598